MSGIGLIVLILVIMLLFGGVGAPYFGGSYGYGMGHGGIGLIGIILVVVVLLMLSGRL